MNPKFKSKNTHCKAELCLRKDAQDLEVSIRIEYPQYKYFAVFLSKESAIRLAAEIQSWCETGEFIKPKKTWVAVIESGSRHLFTYLINAEDLEGAKIKAVCDHIPNPNTHKLIGVLPMPEGE